MKKLFFRLACIAFTFTFTLTHVSASSGSGVDASSTSSGTVIEEEITSGSGSDTTEVTDTTETNSGSDITTEEETSTGTTIIDGTENNEPTTDSGSNIEALDTTNIIDNTESITEDTTDELDPILEKESRDSFMLDYEVSVFPDVINTHENFDAIQYVKTEGIVNGYPDGSYKPDYTINRAELTKIIIEAQFDDQTIENCISQNVYHTTDTFFPDVPKSEWFAKYICVAKINNIVNGYPDGTYKPADNISFVEAAKIIVNTFGYPTPPDNIWYKPYVEVLGKKNAIPTNIRTFEKKITRGEMAEMVYRLKNNITTKSSQQYSTLTHQQVVQQGTDFDIPGVDTERVRATWLSWFNAERKSLGLNDLNYDDRLHVTALDWSSYSAAKGELSHKREGQTAYYDYAIITQWFKDRGLTFKNVNRVTYSENIGAGVYRCSDGTNCTAELIAEIRSTFDFYMSEKGKDYAPHYSSLTNKYFNIIGLGIVIKDGKYYLTVHYGTEIL